MASQEIIDQIAAALDIVDVIDKVYPLKKKGTLFTACCPFHEETTPSFDVNPKEQLYVCRGSCGTGGNVFTFWMKFHNKSFPETLKDLSQLSGIPLDDDRPKSPSERKADLLKTEALSLLTAAELYYRNNLLEDSPSKAYLASRGISPAMVDTFGLGVAKDEWRGFIDSHGGFEKASALDAAGLVVLKAKTATEKGKFFDRFRNAPIFPIRDERGQVVSFANRRLTDPKPGEHQAKYVNGPETSIFVKSKVAYGLYESLQANPHPHNIIVVEGYMDVIMSHQHGLTNTVATMGTSASEAVLKKLFRHSSEIIFCFDGDEAGINAATRALHASLPLINDTQRVKFVFLPSGHDPDSLLREIGAEGYQQYLDTKGITASQYVQKLASKDLRSLTTLEDRAQFFHNAKAMLDLMSPSALKAMMLGRVEEVTGMRPSEYLPYSINLSAGHVNGVDINGLETEIREFIAGKIGAPSADINVNWSMPELVPHRPIKILDSNQSDTRKMLGERMHEVSRILGFESRVTNGVTLAQLLATANSGPDYSRDLAQGLLSRYLDDSNAFPVECQLLVHHMSVIKDGLSSLISVSPLDEVSQGKVSAWLDNVVDRCAAISALESHMNSGMARRVQQHIQSFIQSAVSAKEEVAINTPTNAIDSTENKAQTMQQY